MIASTLRGVSCKGPCDLDVWIDLKRCCLGACLPHSSSRQARSSGAPAEVWKDRSKGTGDLETDRPLLRYRAFLRHFR